MCVLYVFLPLFLLFKHAFLFSRFAKNLKGGKATLRVFIITIGRM